MLTINQIRSVRSDKTVLFQNLHVQFNGACRDEMLTVFQKESGIIYIRLEHDNFGQINGFSTSFEVKSPPQDFAGMGNTIRIHGMLGRVDKTILQN
jgi:hypothetical protein